MIIKNFKRIFVFSTVKYIHCLNVEVFVIFWNTCTEFLSSWHSYDIWYYYYWFIICIQVLNLDDIPSPHNNGFIQCIVMVKNQMVAMDVAKLEILEEEKLLPLALPLSSTSIISSPKTQAQKGKQRLPYFIFVSPDRQLRLGGSGLLKCIAGGNPLPHITWILNGKVLKVWKSSCYSGSILAVLYDGPDFGIW